AIACVPGWRHDARVPTPAGPGQPAQHHLDAGGGDVLRAHGRGAQDAVTALPAAADRLPARADRDAAGAGLRALARCLAPAAGTALVPASAARRPGRVHVVDVHVRREAVAPVGDL